MALAEIVLSSWL